MKKLLKLMLAVSAPLAFSLVGCADMPGQAQTSDLRKVADSLRAGGYVIVFRHGATNRDMADTDPLNLDNVAQQRQLSERGRQVARDVGAAFKTLQIPIGAGLHQQVLPRRGDRPPGERQRM